MNRIYDVCKRSLRPHIKADLDTSERSPPVPTGPRIIQWKVPPEPSKPRTPPPIKTLKRQKHRIICQSLSNSPSVPREEGFGALESSSQFVCPPGHFRTLLLCTDETNNAIRRRAVSLSDTPPTHTSPPSPLYGCLPSVPPQMFLRRTCRDLPRRSPSLPSLRNSVLSIPSTLRETDRRSSSPLINLISQFPKPLLLTRLKKRPNQLSSASTTLLPHFPAILPMRRPKLRGKHPLSRSRSLDSPKDKFQRSIMIQSSSRKRAAKPEPNWCRSHTEESPSLSLTPSAHDAFPRSSTAHPPKGILKKPLSSTCSSPVKTSDAIILQSQWSSSEFPSIARPNVFHQKSQSDSCAGVYSFLAKDPYTRPRLSYVDSENIEWGLAI
ncbi:hypothetical protein BJ138DRAFT_604298 [Hygrophoropsis aurantiaca]|uniref:Uncharacterized protein n=1 Tax=Hygrophoropsis aurantiaca TaxID=72124 RepID=A0ACB8ATQ9_9AGAM|nr:hypothetical protein BJ138DRAFT_604298 [Hygrophoropsis aurantiaca]